jgi:hypothetical protein
MAYQDFVDALCTVLEKQGALKPQDALSLKKKFVERGEARFEYFLLDEGIVTKDDLLNALAVVFKVPAVDVVGYFFDHNLVTMFPKDVMLRNGFIPYQRDGDVLILVATDPANATLASIVGNYVSYDVTFFVGLARDIDDMVKEFYDKSLVEIELDLSDNSPERKETEKIIQEEQTLKE